MASPIVKGNTFNTTDTVTSTTLNNIVDNAAFKDFDGSTEAFNVSGSSDIGTCLLAGGLSVNTTTGQLQIRDSGVTKAKIENVANMKVLGNTSGSAAAPQEVAILDEDDMSTDSATSLATQQSIKAYVDTTAGPTVGFTPTSYTGGESVALPNGLVMKFGIFSNTTDGDKTVNFGTSFNTAVICAQATAIANSHETISCTIVGTPSLGSMVVGIKDGNADTGFYWLAIGH